jgi:hypothetical protein
LLKAGLGKNGRWGQVSCRFSVCGDGSMGLAPGSPWPRVRRAGPASGKTFGSLGFVLDIVKRFWSPAQGRGLASAKPSVCFVPEMFRAFAGSGTGVSPVGGALGSGLAEVTSVVFRMSGSAVWLWVCPCAWRIL